MNYRETLWNFCISMRVLVNMGAHVLVMYQGRLCEVLALDVEEDLVFLRARIAETSQVVEFRMSPTYSAFTVVFPDIRPLS